jgi:2-dehydro-3-deoxyphosphogluconate aldolase/(4S)-4-hydroxy-2-oxoglutarate aldolase
MTEHVMNIISASRLVAIVRLADLSAAVPMSRALLAGGITALEFTLTNPAALEAIAKVKWRWPILPKAGW